MPITSHPPSFSPDSRSSDPGPVRETLPAVAPDVVLSQHPVHMRLRSGRSITVAEIGGDEQLEVRAASGTVLLTMRLTEAGPVLSLTGVSLEIAATKTLSLRAETLQLTATGDLTMESGGALIQRSAGPALREIGGLDRTTAAEMEVEVHPGGISLRANDDVDVIGERVRLNSEDPPMPQSWEEHRSRHAIPIESLMDPSQERTERDQDSPKHR